MTNKNFFSGTEEAVARILALIVTLIFFTIYILSKDVQVLVLDWPKLLGHLAVFWLVYEAVGFVLFLILNQFSKNKALQEKLEAASNAGQEQSQEQENQG